VHFSCGADIESNIVETQIVIFPTNKLHTSPAPVVSQLTQQIKHYFFVSKNVFSMSVLWFMVYVCVEFYMQLRLLKSGVKVSLECITYAIIVVLLSPKNKNEMNFIIIIINILLIGYATGLFGLKTIFFLVCPSLSFLYESN
jgi:hypothetical protein